MQKTIYDQFNHRYYTTLLQGGQEGKAKEYIDYFNYTEKKKDKELQEMRAKLQEHGIKTYVNVTYETAKQKYEELLLSLKEKNGDITTGTGKDVQ